MMTPSHLPISSPPCRCTTTKARAFPLPEKWAHAIPLIVFLCFLILWLFSYPVDVEIKNGEIVAVHRRVVEAAAGNNNNDRIDYYLILASSTSPLASFQANGTRKNGTDIG